MARTKLLARLIAPLAIVTLSVGVATGAGAAPGKAPAQTKGTLVIGNISNATGPPACRARARSRPCRRGRRT